MINFCRLCLDHKGPFVDKNTLQYLILELHYKIEAICNIQINNDAKLPTTICKMCEDKITTMSNFRSMTKYANELIQTYFAEIIQTYPHLLIQLQKQLISLNLTTTTTSKFVSVEVQTENSIQNNESPELIEIKDEIIDNTQITNQLNDDLLYDNFEFTDKIAIKEEDKIPNTESLPNNEINLFQNEDVKVKEEEITMYNGTIKDNLYNNQHLTNVNIQKEIQKLAQDLEIKEEDILFIGDSNQDETNIMNDDIDTKFIDTLQDFNIFSEITNSQEIDPLFIEDTKYLDDIAIIDDSLLRIEQLTNKRLAYNRRGIKRTYSNVHNNLINNSNPISNKHFEIIREFERTLINAQNNQTNNNKIVPQLINKNISSITDQIAPIKQEIDPLEIRPNEVFNGVSNEIYENLTDFDDIPCNFIQKHPITTLERAQLTNDHRYLQMRRCYDKPKYFKRKKPPLMTNYKTDTLEMCENHQIELPITETSDSINVTETHTINNLNNDLSQFETEFNFVSLKQYKPKFREKPPANQPDEIASTPPFYETEFITSNPEAIQIAKFLQNNPEQDTNPEPFTNESNIDLKISQYTTQYLDLCKAGAYSTPQTNQTKPESNATNPIVGATPKNKCTSCKNLKCVFTKQKILYKCIVCDHIITSIPSLKQHVIKSHLALNTHQCNKCSKTFTTKSDLMVHMLLHSNIRKISCYICGKKYKYNHCLRIHLLSHNGIKKYRCNYCRKGFVLIKSLCRHKAQHNKTAKNILCGICGELFTTLTGCKVHEKTHETGEVFSCALCVSKFNRKSELKSHYQTHLTDLFPTKNTF